MVLDEDQPRPVVVIDLAVVREPRRPKWFGLAQRSRPQPCARIGGYSIFEAEEEPQGGWQVARLLSHSSSCCGAGELDLLREINIHLRDARKRKATLIAACGREDLHTLRRRSAANLNFDREGIHAPLEREARGDHPGLPISATIAAELGLPAPATPVPTGSIAAIEVNVVTAFLIHLFELAEQRAEPAPVVRGWLALGHYLRSSGADRPHLSAFRDHRRAAVSSHVSSLPRSSSVPRPWFPSNVVLTATTALRPRRPSSTRGCREYP